MTTLIVIQLILAVLLVVLVLLQGSDYEGLGLGGGGGMGGMMSARGSANLLSRLTAITATLFMVMSVVLTITASVGSDKIILESLPEISTSEEPLTPEDQMNRLGLAEGGNPLMRIANLLGISEENIKKIDIDSAKYINNLVDSGLLDQREKVKIDK